MRSADRAAQADESKRVLAYERGDQGTSRGNASGDQHLERLTGSNNIASAGWRAIHPADEYGKIRRRAEQASAAEPCP